MPGAGSAVIHVHDSPGERRIALLEDGRMAAFLIERPGAPDGYGDIHLARVVAVVPAMAGAFMALADAEAFLPDAHGAAGLSEGDTLPVRVTRAAQGGKGPRVSARLETPLADPAAATGRVRLLQRGPPPLQDLLDAYPGAPIVSGPFSDAIETELDALADPAAILEGGLRATFSPTPALTAIDLDGAATTAARSPKAAAQMAANRAALPALVRQIVLRNLSGAILIDFAGLPTRKRHVLAPPLTEALAIDRLAPRLAGFSPLGFAEISRPRLRPPLHELRASPHGIGLAALRQAARELTAAAGRRMALRAAPTVIAALRSDTSALAALAHGATYTLVLREDPGLHQTWVLEDVNVRP